ncbi:MAG: UDP-N-acetylglucosamine-1-phosphate transferase, partial [Candidatus Hodarchaeota archaeon]
KARPIYLKENGCLASSKEKGAPITLIRTILAYGPLYEYKIVQVMTIIALMSGLLAVITAFTM